jgi:phosphoribosylaminoimidazole carboxylase PurE protein
MSNAKKPLVGIVMGSDSDWPKINKAAAALEEFGVPYEAHVMSAHRTPEVVAEYASSAIERGLQVIIAAAGGAAHLAGVVAAHTTLPVIGLPVPTPDLGGLDSLFLTLFPGQWRVASVISRPKCQDLYETTLARDTHPFPQITKIFFFRTLTTYPFHESGWYGHC